MAELNIHHVNNIEVEKYQLDSGTWVCKIKINCKCKLIDLDNYEYITLFGENKKTFNNIRG